jgi:hypothetical protein
LLTINFFKFGLDHPAVNAWFRGMYFSFFKALEEDGCCVTYTDVKPNSKADVLIVPMGGGQDQASARAMQEFGGPVVLYVGAADYWFRRGFLERWRDRILFIYGMDCSEFSEKTFAELGFTYYHIPFASNPDVMRPLGLPKLYDVAFVGNAGSGSGRHRYMAPLLRAMNDHKVLLVGPGWERYGFPSQSIAWGEMLNIIYNLAHICINILNDEQQKGFDKRLDANNRLFDLAMAGCFQISNATQLVRCYFDESEVLAVDPPEEWVSTILYYLKHPLEAEPYRQAARKRALEEHTWKQRAEQFSLAIRENLSVWQPSRPRITGWNRAIQLRDTILPPYGLREGVDKLKRKMGRFIKGVWKY